MMHIGRYVVLSTAHIRCATAEQLTVWAGMLPADRPIAVAATQQGWFLPTSDQATDNVPEELAAILSFGRDLGCDYILLDCDGECSEALIIYPW